MNDKKDQKLNLGDIITLDIGAIAHGGHFIARHNGQVIFVRHALTDEVAVVKITSVNSKIAFGDAIEILKFSKDRVTSPCKFAGPGNCGGCDFQHISITAQIKFKEFIIHDQLKRIANIDTEVNVISVESDSGLNWRTRFDFSISEKGKIGLYSSSTKNITEIDECLLAVNTINELDIFKRKWKGLDRLKVSRSSSNQINIHRSGKNLSGPTQLNEIIGENLYNISPGSFWQSHKNAPKILIEKVIEFAKLRLGDCVCDLYGGVGLFSVPILKKIGSKGKVHLIESDKSCIKDARKIFEKNENAIIHFGKVEQKIGKIKNIDVVILDPPRNGAGKQVINQIIDKNPRSIIYVSCDPASLARDTKILLANTYSLDKIIGIDLFPMTKHIECISLFEKKII